jgi:ABC-type histidine transport system ATPase subunit
MDNVKDKMGNMDDAMRERYDMLMHKEREGRLTDSDRQELQQLRSRLGRPGNQAA